jgi:hypothetical protein
MVNGPSIRVAAYLIEFVFLFFIFDNERCLVCFCDIQIISSTVGPFLYVVSARVFFYLIKHIKISLPPCSFSTLFKAILRNWSIF